MKTLDQHFIDWEAYVFGYGYGTGEPHTIPALMTFMGLCNEGDYAHAYNYQRLEEALSPLVTWLLINRLCQAGVDIIEYGTSPRYAWLTKQGEALRDYLADKDAGDLIELVCGRTEDYIECYPHHCNCDGEMCENPFWVAPQDRGHTG